MASSPPSEITSTNSYSSADKFKAEEVMIERATPGRALQRIDEFDESVVLAEGEEHINAHTWYLLGVGALSGLLYGYDTGVISDALVNIGTDIGGQFLTSVASEWVTSATSVGALFGAICGGALMDRFGRKRILVAGDFFFSIGALLCCTSFSLVQLIIGRLVLGLGVGIGAGVCAVYLGELSPTRQRGRVVGLQSICITGGQFISYCIGAGMTFHGGWRVLFALSIPPAIFQGVALHFLPESPRYSLIKGNREEARATLKIVYASASDEILERKLDIISATVAIGESFNLKHPSILKRLKAIATTGAYRRPVIVSSSLFLGCQLGGVNSLMYYSATLFKAAGLNNSNAVTIAVGATNVVATSVGVLFLDLYGRRRTLLTGMPLCIVSLCLASMCFYFMTIQTGGKLDTTAGAAIYPYAQNWVIGMITDENSQEVRSLGTAIAVGFQWAGNIILSSTFLSIMNAIGPAGNFGLYAGVITVVLVFTIFCYPEPSGLSMEETAELFTDGFGIKKARAMRSARDAVIKAAHHQTEKA